MPLYEYQCQECGRKAEEIVRGDAEAPMCCGKVMERRMSAPNVTFGWTLDEQSHERGHKDNWVKAV